MDIFTPAPQTSRSTNAAGDVFERTQTYSGPFGLGPTKITSRKISTAAPKGSYTTTSGTGAVQGPQNKPTTTTTPTEAKPTTPSKSTPKKTEKTAEQKYQEDLRKEINKAYQNQIDFLTQREMELGGMLPGQLEQISGQYEALRPELAQQLALQQESGAQGIEQQKQAEL